jgi:hypothetical protein
MTASTARRGAGAPLCAAYSELGHAQRPGQYQCAYLGVDANFLQQEAIELLPPQGVVLELLLDGDSVPRQGDTDTLSRLSSTAATHWH